MTRISRRWCFFVRSIRGSSIVWKCSTIDALVGTTMGLLLSREMLLGAA